MDERDIYRTARLLLTEHGSAVAWQRALGRIADLAGNKTGQATWLQILDAIDEVTAATRADGQAFH